MNIYNRNLTYLCERQGMSITEFEPLIGIPKVRMMEPTPDELVRIAAYFNLPLDVIVLKELKQKNKLQIERIKFIVLDVDGTLTDGGMYFTVNGDQMKRYDTKDGLAIRRKVKSGVPFGIISHGSQQKVVQDRADLLGIEYVYVGKEEKLNVLTGWLQELHLTLEEVAYVGDDINDIPIIRAVGLSACPADAAPDVKRIVDVPLQKDGGRGCVRELLDEWLN